MPECWVSPIGSDNNPGTFAAPKRTAQAAFALGPSYRYYFENGYYFTYGSPFLTASDWTNTSIQCPGKGVRFVVNDNVDAFVFGGACSDILIDGPLIFAGTQRASGAGIRFTSGVIPHENVTLKNITVQDMPEGIILHTPIHGGIYKNLKVRATKPDWMTGDGIAFSSNVSSRWYDLKVVGLNNAYVGGYGILIDSDCDTVNIIGAEVAHTTKAGLSLQNTRPGGTTGPRLVNIDKGWFESCQGNGIEVLAGRIVTLDKTLTDQNKGHGLYVAGGDTVQVSNLNSFLNSRHGVLWNNVDGFIADSEAFCNSQQTDKAFDGFNLAGNKSIGLDNLRAEDHLYTVTNRQRYGFVIAANTPIRTNLQGTFITV